MGVRSIEGWYVIFQTLSVIFIMLTVGTGAGTIITGYIASRRQSAKVANVEHDNLVLQGDVSTEKGKVAGLQKAATDAQNALVEQKGKTALLETAAANAKTDLAEQQGRTASLEKAAADARAAQQQVETELAKQRTRAAKAEKDLLELQRRVKARHLSAEQRARMLEMLRQGPKAEKVLVFWNGDEETRDFALELHALLKDAGWHTEILEAPSDMQPPPRAMWVAYRDVALPSATLLRNALTQGFHVDFFPVSDKPSFGEDVVLGVGLRP